VYYCYGESCSDRLFFFKIIVVGEKAPAPSVRVQAHRRVRGRPGECYSNVLRVSIITPLEETEDGTQPGGRGPGGVSGGVGSKNRGGHVRVYRGGSIPHSHFACLSKLHSPGLTGADWG